MNETNEVNQPSFVEIGRLKPNAKYELLDLANLVFKKPTLVCLSGNMAITNEDAEGLGRMAETYLDLMFKTKEGGNALEHIDIMGIKYAQRPNSKTTGQLTEVAIDQLSNAILALLVDQTGNRLELEKAKQNMSRVSFFTFCKGNVELQNVMCDLNQKLLQVGYREDEITAINNATLEVSYAPFQNQNNKIPSVKILSAQDEKVAWEVTRFKDRNGELSGVYLHQDPVGTLYGMERENASAESIQIVSTNLVNGYHKLVDEHNINFVSRNQNWKLTQFRDKETGKKYYSPNADCVSEMMSWALCRGVENSLQNYKSERYIPNTYWSNLMPELKSIIESYDHQKIAENPSFEATYRRQRFENVRREKQLKMAEDLELNPPAEVVIQELGHATNFQEVMAICEKYDYNHIDSVLPKLNFLTDEERLALAILKEDKLAKLAEKAKPNYQKKDHNSSISSFNEVCNYLRTDKRSFREVLKSCSDCWKFVPDLLPSLKYLTNDQQTIAWQISRVKNNVAKSKLPFVKVPTFEEMVNTLNNANSLEEAVAYLKQNDFLGIEYVLPEVQVLTDVEKNSILEMVGIKPKETTTVQDIILEK